jgi:hypothetical protein
MVKATLRPASLTLQPFYLIKPTTNLSQQLWLPRQQAYVLPIHQHSLVNASTPVLTER